MTLSSVPTSLANYRHILWDWNGTLLDDAWLAVETVNVLLARRGMPLVTPEEYTKHFDFPVTDYYKYLGFDFSQEPFEAIAHEFIAEYEARRFKCHLHPDTLPALEAIRTVNLTQSLLSATQQDSLFQFVDFFDITSYFTELAGLDDHFAHGKVERGRLCLKHLEIDPARVLMVGDTLHDYEVATALGVGCVLVVRGHQSPERLKQCGVPVLKTLKELFALGGLVNSD